MPDIGVITQARGRALVPARPVRQDSKVPTGTYFADWVAPAAQKAFEADFGEVKGRTTLDADLQRIAVRAINNAAIGDAQAAIVAMRPDGRVVAMLGGRSYKASPFNRVTQARRQPGSAFKLFVYLAALRAGWTPDSMIEDRPITIGGWTPANSDGIYRGSITLREAFARSSNAATVRLSESVGRANVLRAARELGISTPLPNSPSVALGTAGVSLLELTAAYAAIAGGRYPVEPRGLALVQEDDGITSFFRRGGSLDRRRDWAPMLDLLWEAANKGTGHRAAPRYHRARSGRRRRADTGRSGRGLSGALRGCVAIPAPPDRRTSPRSRRSSRRSRRRPSRTGSGRPGGTGRRPRPCAAGRGGPSAAAARTGCRGSAPTSCARRTRGSRRT
jgi:penicillin-binding protein 1A